jgi:hypothetical protein
MAQKLKTAIVFFKPGTMRPRKYHNINNLVKFARFCQDLGAYYINLYNIKDGKFEGREWLISNFKKKL